MRGRLVPTKRPCPLCAGRRGRHAWHEDGLDYARCVQCRGFFTDFSETDYERSRHNAWDDEAPDDDATGFYGAARVAAHAAFLERCPPAGSRRLLDVGCGLGFFLERAAAAGWDVHGVEPSVSWARLAAERVGDHRVSRGRLGDATPAGRFDLITAWDVIEHIFDPLPFLRRIEGLLAPGGRVFLRTPNLAYVLPLYRARRRIGHAVQLGPTNHVVYFDAATMRRALAAAGLRDLAWWTLPPPQVATFAETVDERHAPRRSRIVRAKNTVAAASDRIAGTTRGRVVLGSDLDVLAGRPPAI